MRIVRTPAARERERAQAGLDRHLELAQEHPRAADRQRRGVDVGGCQQGVGPGDDDDGVSAGIIDGNGRHAGRHALGPQHLGHVNPLGGKVGQHVGAKHIAPDSGDHGDCGAQPRRGDRLVGALTAIAGLKAGAHQRLTRSRQARRVGDQIHI